ncbi:MAG TPA: hypothetical protein VHA76_07890 [Solirubrobacterales bacterium]|nr:hypothetical protein [Solirubrobacterales bacterium]
MRVRLPSLVGSAVIAALVAGCGGGGSSTTGGESGEARLTHTEWVSQADAICSVDHEANASREAEFEELLKGGLTSPRTREEAAELIRGAVPNVETEVKGIRALRPASADEATVLRVVGGLERTARLDEKFAEALESGSADELEAVIGQVAANGARLETLAGELGTKVCGRPGAGEGAEAVTGEGGREEGDASPAEWKNHANEICRTNREANVAKLEELEQPAQRGLRTARTRHEAAAILEDGIANVEAEIESFRALAVPAAQEAEFEKLIAKLETLVAVEGEFADLLDRGQMEALPRSIDKVLKAELSVRGLALHLGLRVCGKLLQSQGAHSIT